MKKFKTWYEYCQTPGPYYEDESSLPSDPMDRPPVCAIAYYLPQYHRITENDSWWGEGFTEWSNVTRALPRYLGHYQPRRPGALGFYDLSSANVLRQQANIARRGGVSAFCFHHYWFSGTSLLDRPINNLLSNPDINMRFCVNWANENWTRRWDGGDSVVLMEQLYAFGDARRLAESFIPIISDRRYIRINRRPLIMIYRPDRIPNPLSFIAAFRATLQELDGFNPFMIAPHAFDLRPEAYDLDATAGFPPHGGAGEIQSDLSQLDLLDVETRGSAISYDKLAMRMLENAGGEKPLFPGICPSWDNEARRGINGVSTYGSTPAKYGWWLEQASTRAINEQRFQPEQFLFINAWNEWAEGAYLEPDRHFGYAYLAETRRALERVGLGRSIGDWPLSASFTSRKAYFSNKIKKVVSMGRSFVTQSSSK